MTERLDPWEIYAEDPSGVGSPVVFVPGNPEGAPTLVYEVWAKATGPDRVEWQYLGLRTLSKRQVLRWREFGYTVLQSRRASRDHCGTAPLFPIVGTSAEYPADGVDSVPVSEP